MLSILEIEETYDFYSCLCFSNIFDCGKFMQRIVFKLNNQLQIRKFYQAFISQF
ncbi:unnamed protein product [Paramecium sonneborni]|uniref:Uncharacterized protein n=1 Tax=Paramecium sonneborni TaxID=65129 RepID=A0A8S1PNV6_9CILI|nr:unnamed protein product [Paramecium sonneborni]